jgi:phosphatidylglycerol:prolipoprotein diacylglycerol transferase
MFPRLISIGGFTLHTYGVLVATGIAAGVWLSARLGKQRGFDPNRMVDLGVWMVVAGVVGSKLLMYAENPSEVFSLASLQAAGVFYGGFLAAAGVFLWYTHKYRMPWLATGDCFVPGLALGHAIGRIGCFAAGCCWGHACPYPWAVTFTDPYANKVVGVPLNVPLHPSQLYESAALFAICGVLLWIFHRRDSSAQPAGQTFAAYLMLYGAARFLLEYTRDLSEDPVILNLFSLSQVIALALVVAGATLWVSRRTSPQNA